MDPHEIELENRKFALEERKVRYERIGLLTSILIPLAIMLAGYFIQAAVSNEDREWKSGERRAEQRQKIYSDIGPMLNVIYCYVDDVGDYTRYSPEDIIEKKRQVDRLFFVYHAYWSESTKSAYGSFIKSCFVPYQGVATDAKIKSSSQQKRIAFKNRSINWKTSWDEAFSEDLDPDVREKYLNLTVAFLGDLEKNYQLVSQ